MPNLEEEARRVAHKVLKEMNGIKQPSTSDPATPTAITPKAPTPINISRRPSLSPQKSTVMAVELAESFQPQQAPLSPFHSTSNANVWHRNGPESDDIYGSEDEPSHRAVPSKGNAYIISKLEGAKNRRRKTSTEIENEPLFLKAESTDQPKERNKRLTSDEDRGMESETC
jgi:hypothetical protein